MNVLSLFDGMSCGQIALERAGIPVTNYFASEIDKYAIKVTQANYPKTIQLGCITEQSEWYLDKIDLVIGGSPCQGFSFAGKQLNFHDPRSKLFFDYVELLHRYKPKYFLLENVKMKQEYQDIITRMLGGIKPILINSSLVSAQNRNRLYWTNIPGVTQPDDKGILLKDIIEGDTVDRDKAHFVSNRQAISRHQKQLIQVGSLYKNNGDAGRIYSIEGKGRTLKGEAGGGGAKMGLIGTSETDYRKLTPLECERLQTVPENYTNHVSNTQRYKMLGNGWTVDVIAHIFKGLI